MDHTPEPFPVSPSNPPVLDEAQLDALLRQTIEEQVASVIPPSGALPRLNARLDVADPPKRWSGPLRLAGAFATALLLLALLTPVGRLAAAGVHDAAQTVITTVKQIASGDSGARTTPPNAPSATGGLGSRTAPTNGAGSPATGGTANPALATRAGTPSGTASQVAPLPASPRTTAQPTGTASAINTRLENTPSAAATTSPTATASGTATPVNQTVAPSPKPPAQLTATPIGRGP